MKSLALLALAIVVVAGARAQTQPAAARARVTGTVVAVDAATGQMTLKTDRGDMTTVLTTEKSFLRRLPPGETDTKKALPLTIKDVTAGDRAVAIGQFGADQKSFEARTVYLMTSSDVAQVHAKEQEDWQKRGTTGIATEVNSGAKSVVIKAGRGQYTVQMGAATEFLRYAPDSAKLADAKPGALGEIRVGDEVHALGNKGGDGTVITAEKVVSGSFRQIAATIDGVDAEGGTLKVKNLATKKMLVLKITADTMIRRLPEQMAAFLARRYNTTAAGGGANAAPPGGGNWPQGTQGAGAGRGTGGGSGYGGRGGGDLKQMLDHLPVVQLADLKRGDAVMVSTTEGTDDVHLTGIMMLAGVEPLLTASANSTRDIMGGWNLGGGEGSEGN